MSNLTPPGHDPKLAALFALAQADAQTWSQSELAAVLQHQLRAPLEADLATVLSAEAAADGIGAAQASSRPAANLKLWARGASARLPTCCPTPRRRWSWSG
jgi:hypothetical protein